MAPNLEKKESKNVEEVRSITAPDPRNQRKMPLCYIPLGSR